MKKQVSTALYLVELFIPSFKPFNFSFFPSSYFFAAFLGVGDNPYVVFPDAEALHPRLEVGVEGGGGRRQERFRPDQFPKQQFSIS
jgi:hypothetical protein